MSDWDDEPSERTRPRTVRIQSIDLPIREDMAARHLQQLNNLYHIGQLQDDITALNFPKPHLKLSARDDNTQDLETALTRLGIEFKRTQSMSLTNNSVFFGYAIDAMQLLAAIQSDVIKAAWYKSKVHEEKQKDKAPSEPLARRTVPLMESERTKILDIAFGAIKILGLPRHKPATADLPSTDFSWITNGIPEAEDGKGKSGGGRKSKTGSARG